MQDAAKALHTVFGDLNIVPTDVVAGLILLKRDQRRKKENCSCPVCLKVSIIINLSKQNLCSLMWFFIASFVISLKLIVLYTILLYSTRKALVKPL